MTLTRSNQNSEQDDDQSTQTNPTPTILTTSKGSNIAKLTGEKNYYSWSIQIEAWLMDLGLWVYINKTNLTITESELSKKS
ncbi:CLUMA_CG010724, isoform A [Clunio marinus]|uniref:CLUMA_CG010724, isoform A n=1 Tax=Clunio marinus TaxID=568069 RepID=A0A1J1IAU4_9DIPT|nr:CLUMA_CG010724, isoform A [Clunio marinus]